MKEETYIASAIRHIAPAHYGEIVATALFEKTVSLWDTSTGNRVSEFETILSFGGTRLALSRAEGACLAAAYKIHGLACYNTPIGKLRWQRKDLKKIQQIVVKPDEKYVYCCFDEGSCQLIEVATGKTTERIRGLRRIWLDSRYGFQLRKSSNLSVVDSSGKQSFKIEPNSFAVLDAAFSKNNLAISEAGADVRIFDLSSGQEVLRYAQPRNHHILELSSSAHGPAFYGVQWNYNDGGPKSLLRFSPEPSEKYLAFTSKKTLNDL
jgi:WD40 repeat protein